jgi:ATP-dependent Zn protease
MKLAATAYHEAGHAVAHFLRRRRIDRITIVEDDESLGRVSGRIVPADVEFLEYGPATLRQLKAVEDDIIGRLAGAAAECRHTGRPRSEGAGSDVRGAYDLAAAVQGSPRTTDAYLDYLGVVAEELVE